MSYAPSCWIDCPGVFPCEVVTCLHVGKPLSCGVLSLHVGVALHHLLQIFDTADLVASRLSALRLHMGVASHLLLSSENHVFWKIMPRRGSSSTKLVGKIILSLEAQPVSPCPAPAIRSGSKAEVRCIRWIAIVQVGSGVFRNLYLCLVLSCHRFVQHRQSAPAL